MPLLKIFKRGMIGNTLTACWFQAAGFVTYYSINALFATHLQHDLHLSPALIATPIAFANILVFLASSGWGWVSDKIGRRPAMIIPALCAIPLVPIYLFSGNFTWVVIAFVLQGAVRRRWHVWAGAELSDTSGSRPRSAPPRPGSAITSAPSRARWCRRS